MGEKEEDKKSGILRLNPIDRVQQQRGFAVLEVKGGSSPRSFAHQSRPSERQETLNLHASLFPDTDPTDRRMLFATDMSSTSNIARYLTLGTRKYIIAFDILHGISW